MKFLRSLWNRAKAATAPPKSPVVKGEFYRVRNAKGEWLFYCHTTGSAGWTTDLDLADRHNSADADWIWMHYRKLGEPVELDLIPRSDPMHPRRHHIPAPTDHFTLHQTRDGLWYARAMVDQVAYESIAGDCREFAIREAKQGSMFSNVKHAPWNPYATQREMKDKINASVNATGFEHHE